MKKLLYILILASVCMSCRSIKYMPIETIKHDSIYINRIKYDSIYHKDSIFISVKGDTVYTYKYQYQYRDKLIRDTVSVTRIDSIQVPFPIEKKLTKWQNIKLELGGWAFGVIIAFSLIVVGWLVYRIRKK